MEFFDVIQERHSVRAYTGQSVEPGILRQILEAMNQAPSAGNLQAYDVYLVCDEERKASLAGATRGQEFLAQAAVILVFCTHAARSAEKYGRRGTDLYCLQDAAIACTYAMLAATALGLSTVWVGAFDEEKARLAIDAPETHRPVAMLPIGYPAEDPPRRSRRSLSDLVHVEK
jgi:nitroreductase